MKTQILNAISILPRIELLSRYLEEEVNSLEWYLQENSADKYIVASCQRIIQLAWMSEDISNKVFEEVNTIMGVN